MDLTKNYEGKNPLHMNPACPVFFFGGGEQGWLELVVEKPSGPMQISNRGCAKHVTVRVTRNFLQLDT